jgi:hypothetical protein
LRRIFISHSSRDSDAAKSLKEYLEANGHSSLFLDFDPADGIPAGRDWEREIYQRIRTCQAMIVICSSDSMASRWCFMEITHARALGKLLLALKIDDCLLDGVLADRQAVDLTRDGEKAYERLLQGIAAAGLDPAKTFPWDANRSPYPGLLAFQQEDAAVFFGRSDEITQGLELLNRLQHLGDPRVVMVLGASGTGKSSLVRAGLVPRLRRDAERWIVVDPFRPRADPMRALSDVLTRGGWADIAEGMLRRTDPDVLVEALVAVQLRGGRPDAKVLLVIDQFEELLGTEQAPPFLTQLRRVTEHQEAPVVVLGTMRSDFLDRFQNSSPLLDLRYEVLSLGPMSESDITEIIEEPAKEKDVELEAGLVTALVEDAGTQNALPLLAFTLRELWERYASDGQLTLEEYRDKLGGVQRVVGEAADNVMKSARMTREQERALRAAFLAMMRITEDGKYARRAVKWNDLPERIRPLLERFVAARLLVSRADGSERSIEVAHERLFESWGQLHGWIKDNDEAVRIRADVESAAKSWDGPKTRDLLWQGARVSRAREFLADGTLLLDDAGRRFIDASERSEKVRRWRVIGAVSVFAIFAAVLALIALISAQRANSSAVLAEERAKAADVERMRALSAQNFAEHQRVRARAQTEGVREDEKKALEAIAPKYLDQSKKYEEEANRLQKALDDWRREKGVQAATPAALFTLEVFRAEVGTAFLVHYGATAPFRHILIDGGSRRTYRDVLKPRFDELRPDGKALPLSLVVASQTDIQHMEGLIRLVEDLQQQPSTSPSVTIDALWSNAFVPGPPESAPALVRLQPKGKLVAGAKALGVPLNAPFTRMVAAPEAGAARVSLDERLTITVLSPRVQWLREFADFWLGEWRRRGERQDVDPQLLAVLNDYDILETFADSKIELLPSPIEIVDPANAPGRERSVVNLASTVLMLELDGKRMLLTADARSDVILSALAQAGYTDEHGNMEVDVLVLPHGGSDQNVSVEFFRRVKARHYVMSADGTHTNPEVSTFEMLFEARRGDSRSFSIGLTYAPEEYKKNYPVRDLCVLLARERGAGTPFEIVTPKKAEGSFGIDLGSNATFVDKGLRNAVCER